jgi:acyl carrier protein
VLEVPANVGARQYGRLVRISKVTSAEILARIEPIVRDLFDEYDGQVTPELSAKDVAQWDSLANVQLIVMVEKAFGMKYSASEIGRLSNLGAFADVVAKRAKA